MELPIEIVLLIFMLMIMGCHLSCKLGEFDVIHHINGKYYFF